MTQNNQPQAKKRLDYQAPHFLVSDIELIFELFPTETLVIAESKVIRNGVHEHSLVLDGVDLNLQSVFIDGKEVFNYQVDDKTLTLATLAEAFTLKTVCQINPKNNLALEGLYLSNGAYCTQCEAEGFRKITYCLDRPDVLSRYTVTIFADETDYPYLLSNGNKIEQGQLPDGRHWTKWQDPYNKPCYLFALVAGDFDLLEDSYQTISGRDVALELYVEKGNLSKGQHALTSLKKAMKWDEDTYSLEYDLDIYMIVAVDFFNMGAMENKGLNVFNSQFVLASPETATDADYFNIESVIAHEYFHNWTGNRVTCRDWFQLSLKEGLTVFRDQEFSSDMASRAVNRIEMVRTIREHQFAEDDSPMSHPIRPDKVMEMNNFYTVTVYNKGAEVIRMIETIIGKEAFIKGVTHYLASHDGTAATCDDFIDSMEIAADQPLQQFRLWYSQSGTPLLSFEKHYDEKNQTLTINVQQDCPPTADQTEKQPLYIPLKFELLNQNETRALQVDITQAQQTIKIEHISEDPTIGWLSDFSAPVKTQSANSNNELADLMTLAKDDVTRWDAVQQLASRIILADASSGGNGQVDGLDLELERAFSQLFDQVSEDNDVLPLMFELPAFETLIQQVDSIDVEKLCGGINRLKYTLANHFQSKWSDLYNSIKLKPYEYNQEDVHWRRLKNISLKYLAFTDESKVLEHFEQADNMTDTLGALTAAKYTSLNLFESLMDKFADKWENEPLVMDKWFRLHATHEREDILEKLDTLMEHQAFSLTNPNRVRALLGSFAFFNPLGFHSQSGAGYRYITEQLLTLDKSNPQIAARLITPLLSWKKFDNQRQQQMIESLQTIHDAKSISSDLYEKVSKSLIGWKG